MPIALVAYLGPKCIHPPASNSLVGLVLGLGLGVELFKKAGYVCVCGDGRGWESMNVQGMVVTSKV